MGHFEIWPLARARLLFALDCIRPHIEIMTWEKYTSNQTCKCGRIYEVTQTNLPVRDKDEFTCSCGHQLRSWNGGVMYSYKLVSKPDAKP